MDNFQKTTETINWNPGIAGVLSLIIPGAGQLYKRQIGRGLLWLLFVFMGYAIFIFPGLILHIFCIINAVYGNRKKTRSI